MATANQRIPVLVSPEEKERISRRARQAGLSMGEFLRRAAAAYSPREDERVLSAMIDQMLQATERAERAIDEALEFVAASEARLARLDEEGRGEGR